MDTITIDKIGLRVCKHAIIATKVALRTGDKSGLEIQLSNGHMYWCPCRDPRQAKILSNQIWRMMGTTGDDTISS